VDVKSPSGFLEGVVVEISALNPIKWELMVETN
jgi:hypothetical protein